MLDLVNEYPRATEAFFCYKSKLIRGRHLQAEATHGLISMQVGMAQQKKM